MNQRIPVAPLLVSVQPDGCIAMDVSHPGHERLDKESAIATFAVCSDELSGAVSDGYRQYRVSGKGKARRATLVADAIVPRGPVIVMPPGDSLAPLATVLRSCPHGAHIVVADHNDITRHLFYYSDKGIGITARFPKLIYREDEPHVQG